MLEVFFFHASTRQRLHVAALSHDFQTRAHAACIELHLIGNVPVVPDESLGQCSTRLCKSVVEGPSHALGQGRREEVVC